MKHMLNKCISENQSAFVLGCSILDNALATIQIMPFMNYKTKSNQDEVSLKIGIFQ